MIGFSKKGAVAFLGILAIIAAASAFIWMVNQQDSGVVQFSSNLVPKYPIVKMVCENAGGEFSCVNGDHAFTASRSGVTPFKWGDEPGQTFWLGDNSLTAEGKIKFCHMVTITEEECLILGYWWCTDVEKDKEQCLLTPVGGDIFESGYKYKGIIGYTYETAPGACGVGLGGTTNGIKIYEMQKSGFTAYMNKNNADSFGDNGWLPKSSPKTMMCAYTNKDVASGTVSLYRMHRDDDYILAAGDLQKNYFLNSEGYTDDGIIEGFVFQNDIGGAGYCGDTNCNYGEDIYTCPGDNCAGGGGGGGEIDSDGDGVLDSNDLCPNIPGLVSNNGCPTSPNPSGKAPKGVMEGSTCTAVTGWTCDEDDWNAQLAVHFYTDNNGNGPYNSEGEFLGDTIANIAVSGDTGVAAQCGNNNAHRFSFLIPPNLKDSATHPIYSFAIDNTGDSSTSLKYILDGQPYDSLPIFCNPVPGDRYCGPGETCPNSGDCPCPNNDETCTLSGDNYVCVPATLTCPDGERQCPGSSECTDENIPCRSAQCNENIFPDDPFWCPQISDCVADAQACCAAQQGMEWCATTESCVQTGQCGPAVCGDNFINQATEQCDGTDLNNENCQSQGYDLGLLRCYGINAGANKCKYNTEGCAPMPGASLLQWKLSDNTGEIETITQGSSVKLVAEKGGLPGLPATVTFNIYKGSGTGIIATLTNNSHALPGKASAVWTPGSDNTGSGYWFSTDATANEQSGMLTVLSGGAVIFNRCSDYQTQNACDNGDAYLEDPIRDEFICDDDNECSCEWDTDEGVCGFHGTMRDSDNPDVGIGTCTVTTTCSACIDGSQTCDPIILDGTDCNENQFLLDCGISLAEMPFFGIWEFAISLMGVVIIYTFILRKKKE